MLTQYTIQDVQKVFRSRSFPKLKDPTVEQVEQLEAYRSLIINRFEMIMLIREDKPNWLPQFNPIF